MSFTRMMQLHRQGLDFDVAVEEAVVYKGGSGGKTTSTSTPTQSANYANLLSKSDAWLNEGGLDQNYGGSANFDTVADLTDDQKAAISGMSQQAQNLQSLYNGQGSAALGNYLGSYDPNKTGLNAAMDAANNRLDYNYNTTVAPQIRQGAQDTGQFGSTRHGIAEGIAQSNLGMAKADNAASMAYQDQQTFNQNQLSALNNLANITTGLNSGNTAQYNAGALQQTQNQSEIAGQLEKWAYENNVDLNNLIAYKNLISGDMGGETKGKTSSGGGGFMSMLGSMGGQFAGQYAGAMGGQMGGGMA